MALIPIRIATIQQGNPIVDGAGRPTTEFIRRINETFGQVGVAINAVIDAQATSDAALAQALVALEQAEAGLAQAQQALADAAAAQTVGEQGVADAGDAYARADAAYNLASGAVQKDAGPEWQNATGAQSRATFDSTTVTTPELAARLGALIDDLRANGALT